MSVINLFPSSSGAVTRACAPAPAGFVSTVSGASYLPVGKAVLSVIGGIDLSAADDENSQANELESRINIPTGITPANLDKFTLYDCLGLGSWADCVDLDVIKKAYHKAVLIYHPDKQSYYDADGVEDRSVFLKIQTAYNTLCNEDKRRAYDSQLPFDENIPSDDFIAKALAKGPEKYLRVYDKVFRRNARFAVIKPVPMIGTVDTPIEEVNAFYEYWTRFESWRDFTGKGAENDPDSAQDRYEKRHMQKENEKLAKKLKTKEMQRIINLVERAKQYDPRVLADKEAKKAAKEAKLREREEEKLRQEEEAKAAVAAVEVAKEVSKADKMAKEKQRKLESKTRSTTKKLLKNLHARAMKLPSPPAVVSDYGSFTFDDVEVSLCGKLPQEELAAFNDSLGGEPASKDGSTHFTSMDDAAVTELLARVAAEIERSKNVVKSPVKIATSASSSAAAAVATPERTWKRDELSKLAQSIKKFPAGAPNRWLSIAAEMNTLLKPSVEYTMDECLKTANNIVKMMSTAK